MTGHDITSRLDGVAVGPYEPPASAPLNCADAPEQLSPQFLPRDQCDQEIILDQSSSDGDSSNPNVGNTAATPNRPNNSNGANAGATTSTTSESGPVIVTSSAAKHGISFVMILVGVLSKTAN